VEYLKKMGLKEYENGTVIYYEDETDVKSRQNILNEDSQESMATEVDFDSELISNMFYGSAEKQIRISRDHKENTQEHLN
jgi:hypothetical protein